ERTRRSGAEDPGDEIARSSGRDRRGGGRGQHGLPPGKTLAGPHPSRLARLASLGWTDTLLLERSELTAGSTWHAAGLLPLFNMSYTVGQLHKYSVDLYKRLPAETGQEVSFHVTGNLRLATCRERMDEYQKYCGTANTIGVPFRIITPDEVKALWPLVELGDDRATPKIVGALYHPHDGHIAPADLTMALRRAARSAGAEIHEQTEGTGANPPGG